MDVRSDYRRVGQEFLQKLTPQGKEWFLTAADPFHDAAVTPAGYPDAASGMSQVVVSNKSLVIDKPAACAGNWDVVIAALPLHTGVSLHFLPTVQSGAVYGYDTDLTSSQWAGLTVWAADSGEQLTPNAGGWAPTNFQQGHINSSTSTDDNYQCRVIAQGFEVYNTTAEIYKQGSVYVGRIPQSHNLTMATADDTGVAALDVTYLCERNAIPPGTVDDARRYPGVKSWNAAEGCYCPVFQSGIENPVTMGSAKMRVYSQSTDINAAGAISKPFVTATYKEYAYAVDTKMDTTFAFFSGLSNETTLNVVYKTYVEYFPVANDPYILLATPSPCYDVAALKLYSAVVTKLPPGVPVSMNPKGEYFGTVLKAIASVVSAVGWGLDMVIPGAGVVGTGLGTALGAAGAGAELRYKTQLAKARKQMRRQLAIQEANNQQKLNAAKSRMNKNKMKK